MTWTLAKTHKGPVKGLRASGPQGSDPLFTHYTPIFSNKNSSTQRHNSLPPETVTITTTSQQVGVNNF